MAIYKTVIQLRRATTAEWLANKDVVPAAGEPCFDLELNTLKIGNGVKTYEQLDAISGGAVSVSTDGKSIVIDGNVLKLAGFDAAAIGTLPRKNADNNIEWVDAEVLDNKIDGIYLNTTLLDIVDKKVTIPLGAGLKGSDEITIAADGTLGINKISFDKITQEAGEIIILDGGGAAG
jgi:hypothetical protein